MSFESQLMEHSLFLKKKRLIANSLLYSYNFDVLDCSSLDSLGPELVEDSGVLVMACVRNLVSLSIQKSVDPYIRDVAHSSEEPMRCPETIEVMDLALAVAGTPHTAPNFMS